MLRGLGGDVADGVADAAGLGTGLRNDGDLRFFGRDGVEASEDPQISEVVWVTQRQGRARSAA